MQTTPDVMNQALHYLVENFAILVLVLNANYSRYNEWAIVLSATVYIG